MAHGCVFTIYFDRVALLLTHSSFAMAGTIVELVNHE